MMARIRHILYCLVKTVIGFYAPSIYNMKITRFCFGISGGLFLSRKILEKSSTFPIDKGHFSVINWGIPKEIDRGNT